MHVIVMMKLVPDVVEDLEVAADGVSLNREFLRMIPSESDEHALEQALLLKERAAAKVTVLALDAPGIDETLFAALAKGADRAVKVHDGETALSTRAAARLLAAALAQTPGLLPADLVLTGAQAIDDLDGLHAPLAAHHLGWPFLGVVTAVAISAPASAVVVKEFPGGVRGEFEVTLPAVLGIQSAEKPPRYVPVAKVRAVMRSGRIDAIGAPAAVAEPVKVAVVQMAKPEASEHAEMLEGTPDVLAGKVGDILTARGLL